jgi:hypothetical protein
MFTWGCHPRLGWDAPLVLKHEEVPNRYQPSLHHRAQIRRGFNIGVGVPARIPDDRLNRMYVRINRSAHPEPRTKGYGIVSDSRPHGVTSHASDGRHTKG